VLYCTDGSPASVAALAAGRRLVGEGRRAVLVTVVGEHDPSLVSGTGFAGGVMSPDEAETFDANVVASGRQLLDDVAAELRWELADSDRVLLRGAEGREVCRYAEEVGAAAIVIGSRGHGGLKRAVLGSVSDFIVRNAPCSVVVSNPDAATT
jgi:nucleotide-binding universal stress UspA family protein